jgi:hypothetical protein
MVGQRDDYSGALQQLRRDPLILLVVFEQQDTLIQHVTDFLLELGP